MSTQALRCTQCTSTAIDWCHNCGDVAYCARCIPGNLFKEETTLHSCCSDCRCISFLVFLLPSEEEDVDVFF